MEVGKCPCCGSGGSCDLDWEYRADPIDTVALPGNRIKLQVREVATLKCTACGLNITGRRLEDGYEFDQDLVIAYRQAWQSMPPGTVRSGEGWIMPRDAR